MKCPYPNCRKDYNEESWPKVMDRWITPPGTGGSIAERAFHNRLYIVTRKCKFCQQLFHDIYVGRENFEDHTKMFEELDPTLESLVSYPVSKTKDEKNLHHITKYMREKKKSIFNFSAVALFLFPKF